MYSGKCKTSFGTGHLKIFDQHCEQMMRIRNESSRRTYTQLCDWLHPLIWLKIHCGHKEPITSVIMKDGLVSSIYTALASVPCVLCFWGVCMTWWYPIQNMLLIKQMLQMSKLALSVCNWWHKSLMLLSFPSMIIQVPSIFYQLLHLGY